MPEPEQLDLSSAATAPSDPPPAAPMPPSLHEQLSGTDLPTVENPPPTSKTGDAQAGYFAGKASIALEQSAAVDLHVETLRQDLLEKLTTGEIAPRDLVEAVIDRERVIAQLGRDVTTGKHASRGLREVVRGLLSLAKHGDPQQIETTLRSLGAEPVDRRQIKQHGTALGSGTSDTE